MYINIFSNMNFRKVLVLEHREYGTFTGKLIRKIRDSYKIVNE